MMSDSRKHIDTLWQRALRESVEAGEEFTRYRFAAMIEAETARRCAEIADQTAIEYRWKYKGTPGPDGVRRGGSYDPHDDGMSDGAAVVEDAIRKEFPEAWK